MLYRVKAYIENGWASRVVNPDLPMGSCSSKDLTEVDSTVSPPTEGWESIQRAFNTPSEVPKFSHSNILSQEQQLMAELQVTLNLLTNQLKIFFDVAMYKP